MNDTPIRHMLFLTILLFVILSSGCLQCALSCYDSANQAPSGNSQVVDCHPLEIAELIPTPASSFCHLSHSTSQARREPVLSGVNSGPALALSSSKFDYPQYRSAEPFKQSPVILTVAQLSNNVLLPLSQRHKQLRTTILLM